MRGGVFPGLLLLCHLRAVWPLCAESLRAGLPAHRLRRLHRCADADMHERLDHRPDAALLRRRRLCSIWNAPHGLWRARSRLRPIPERVAARDVVGVHGTGDRRRDDRLHHLDACHRGETWAGHVDAADVSGVGARGGTTLPWASQRHRSLLPFCAGRGGHHVCSGTSRHPPRRLQAAVRRRRLLADARYGIVAVMGHRRIC
mmetsp:Transcript_66239/g.184453  ORF Transcript_66239/g.184453 Transcript_66239/m.184453 type:complete len:202 (+) Transcript_66239:756-1361(+)